MDTLLDALQEGRLFELPDNDKADALQFLAHIIEAFPEIPPDSDIAEHVMRREETTNTAIGNGWACPHARVPIDEDLKCVIGWSPSGIDYQAPDGQPVFLIAMYFVPENQRNHYLREVSTVARALGAYPKLDGLRGIDDLHDVRNYLLDLIGTLKDTPSTDARARMIRLQAKATHSDPVAGQDLSQLIIEPFTLISTPETKPIALTQDSDLMTQLDATASLADLLVSTGECQMNGWKIVRRSQTTFCGNRSVLDCLAIKAMIDKT